MKKLFFFLLYPLTMTTLFLACQGKKFPDDTTADNLTAEKSSQDDETPTEAPTEFPAQESETPTEKPADAPTPLTNTMIVPDIDSLRDPFILLVDGVYYAYGTGWVCFKNTSGNLQGPWENLGVVASVSLEVDDGEHWAPEVYAYNGAYYMFTTYRHKRTGRGCTIMKSDSPEGPFVEITNGHITPAGWGSLDGTLYIDPEGQPWMIFVRAWDHMTDKVGSFAAAKLSEDFTHFTSRPIELFKANEPVWDAMGVTDGCWMYTTREGELLMIWSNFDADGYVIAIARSSNGRLDGEWIHEDTLLYSKGISDKYDGGHGMIFTDTDGQMYLSFHSPNSPVGSRREQPVFLAIREENGTLVWDERNPPIPR